MIESAKAVIEFNRDLLGTKPRAIGPMRDDEFQHLIKCFREEFLEEFPLGHMEQDVIQAVDALLDGIYFAIGGLYKMGLTAEQIHSSFMTVHEANMKKKRGQIEKRATGDVPDAYKPLGWVPPEETIAKILGLSE